MENKNIIVIFSDGIPGEVMPSQLDKLIWLRMIKMFYRSGKWATIGVDPIRGRGGIYIGSERRHSSYYEDVITYKDFKDVVNSRTLQK